MLVAQHMRLGPVLVSGQGVVMVGGFQAEEWERREWGKAPAVCYVGS